MFSPDGARGFHHRSVPFLNAGIHITRTSIPKKRQRLDCATYDVDMSPHLLALQGFREFVQEFDQFRTVKGATNGARLLLRQGLSGPAVLRGE